MSTSPFRFGYCSISSLWALIYSSHSRAQVVALPNPSFEPKTHRWRPGAGVPSREVPSQNCALCTPKEALCTPKEASPPQKKKRPRNPLKTAKRREMVATLHVRLECPVTNSLLLPSNSTICPRNGPIMAKNGRGGTQHMSNGPKTKNGPYLGLRGSKPISEGT